MKEKETIEVLCKAKHFSHNIVNSMNILKYWMSKNTIYTKHDTHIYKKIYIFIKVIYKQKRNISQGNFDSLTFG